MVINSSVINWRSSELKLVSLLQLILFCRSAYMKPVSVLIHVPDVDQGLDWYKKAFPNAKERYLEAFNMRLLDISGFMIEIVKADAKVGSGKAGSVLYWAVSSVNDALEHFESLGAKLYRGPIAIEEGLRMCQIEDPFGNLIGLRGQ